MGDVALVPAAIGADGRSILLCTLGASWAVVVEAFAFLAPSVVDLYAQHPERAALEAERREHALREPDEVWVLSTSNAVVAAKDAAPGSELWEWWRGIDRRPVLRVWVASDVGALASPRECASMTELTLRVALLGAERARGGQLVMSLAGGRKTMSADLQRAALTFGCQGLVHVVGTEPLPPELRNPAPTLLRGPLPAALAGALRPVVVGRAGRSELLDLATADRPAVTSERYPISLADPCDAEVLRYSDWRLVDGPSGGLLGELERRELEAHALLGNFLASVQLAEAHENWRSLYRLPPARIEELRRTRLGPEHAAWLERLPRAELHCHLGGLLDRAAQREVARAVWDTATNAERSRAVELTRDLLGLAHGGGAWPWDWPDRLRSGGAALRSVSASRVLLESSDEWLDSVFFGVTEPRVALATSHPQGFAAYERPGELMGSALLGHCGAVGEYARQALLAAERQGLRYLELRASPHKYLDGDAKGFVRAFAEALGRHASSTGAKVCLLWTVDRRGGLEELRRQVAEAVAVTRELDVVVGFDLAGDESQGAPAVLSAAFVPAFEACLPLTIHAGETTEAGAVWAASYHLHADRVGHGLTLVDRSDLAERFRNRRLLVELCPSSNREVVGFRDPAVPGTDQLPEYPLRRFIDLGIPVAICTDNPAISRTSSVDEFLTAARMTPGGVTLWEVLALTRQAFVHAFLPAKERERLTKEADVEVFAVCGMGGL